jgi:hypothetical protein
MKTMKKIVLYATILPALLALVSCYWRPNSSTGGLSVNVSGITPKAIGDVVRIYLIADGLLFSTGGGVPFAAEISAEDGPEKTISIDGLPVGPAYKAMVGYGPVTGGIFRPLYYGESEQFVVIPNADTAVPVWIDSIQYPYITYTDVSYSPDLLGRPLTGVVEDDNGGMNAAEAGRLHYFSFSYPDSWSLSESLDLGYRVYGLSRGLSLQGFVGTYLNTGSGIFPFINSDGYQIDTTFSAGWSGSEDIRGSGSLSLLAGGYIDYAVFFRREGGLGGAYVAFDSYLYTYPAPSAWNWLNRDVAGVTDMVVSENNAYYAAGGSLFALRPDYLRDPALPANRVDLPVPAPVQSLGFRPYISGAEGGTLYLGTTNGVWQMDVNETSTSPYIAQASSPVQVAAAGDSVERVAIYGSTTYHEAYLSRYYLYIVKSGYEYRIPFFAVLPGRATAMAWDNSYNYTLYIAGTEGLASIYAGS